MRSHATLFGTQDLLSIRRKDFMTCYYFKESAFYSHHNELDGVIITYHNQMQLCVNTLSPYYQSFAKSELYQALSKGLCDLEILKENVMIANCDFDRKEVDKIIKYLSEKYNLDHLQTINMKQYLGMIVVPKKEN
jgi:hypothetical protein